MDERQSINCTVDSCYYWGHGNKCRADEIIVTSDSFGSSLPGEVDDTHLQSLSPTPVSSCAETCCKTFVARDEERMNGIERLSLE